jgi:hypothetical protein
MGEVSFDFQTVLDKLSKDIYDSRQGITNWIGETRAKLDTWEALLAESPEGHEVPASFSTPDVNKVLARLKGLTLLRQAMEARSMVVPNNEETVSLMRLVIVAGGPTGIAPPFNDAVLTMTQKSLVDIGFSARQFSRLVNYCHRISSYGKTLLATRLKYEQEALCELALPLGETRVKLLALPLGELNESLVSEDEEIRITAARIVDLWKSVPSRRAM